jgi:hypothetical protein
MPGSFPYTLSMRAPHIFPEIRITNNPLGQEWKSLENEHDLWYG